MTAGGYVLRDGDTLYAYLEIKPEGSHYSQTLTPDHTVTAWWPGDSQAMSPLEGDYDKRGWWTCETAACAGAPDRIEYQPPPKRRLTGYRIRDDFRQFATDARPATVTPEWMRAFEDEDGMIFDPAVQAMYEPTYEREEQQIGVIDGPFVVLEGAPAPQDDRTWQATLPSFLRYRTEYLHLFPGKLLGFRVAVKQRLEALPDLDVDYYPDQSESRMFVKVPGGRGYVYSGTYRVPAWIAGENREDAVRRWDAKLDEIIADVRAKAEVCDCCQGTGLPPHKRQPEKKKRRARR